MLFLHYDANAQNSSNSGVCDRTQQIQDEIIYRLEAEDCSSVTDYALSTITRLQFYSKNLKAGDFDGLENLEGLSLDKNQLTDLPEGIFDGLESLQRLDLHENQLVTLPEGIFNDLRSLKSLFLNNNSLRTLSTGVFSRQINLEQLYLDDNQLSELHADMFSGLDDLWLLDISGNQLKTFPEPESIIYSLKNLRSLHFYSNAENIAHNQDIFSQDWGGDVNDMPPHPYASRFLILRHDIVLCEKDVRTELLRLYRDLLSRRNPQYHIYIYGYNSTEQAQGRDDGLRWEALDPEKKHGTGPSKYTGKDGIVVLPDIDLHDWHNKHVDVLLAKSPDKASPEIIFRQNAHLDGHFKNLSSCSGILPGG